MGNGNTSLVVAEPVIVPTLVERLTEQFYAWERRGRGWQEWDDAVVLEPPFVPYYRFLPTVDVFDDCRKPTFFSHILESIKAVFVPPPPQRHAGDFEDVYRQLEPAYFYPPGVVVELQIHLPAETKLSAETAAQFLLSLSLCASPLSFEIIGTSQAITLQFACYKPDQELLYEQIRAFYPDCVIMERFEFLQEQWEKSKGDPLLVDFGLSSEFTCPLRFVEKMDLDPFIAVTGALSSLKEGELGAIQILFQSVEAPWAESILHSVLDFEGDDFFLDAPEMVKLARQKIASPLWAVALRTAAKGKNTERAWQITRNLGGCFTQLTSPGSNELIPLEPKECSPSGQIGNFLDRLTCRSGMILNTDELLSLVHLPAPTVRSEKLSRLQQKTKAAPPLATSHAVILGVNQHVGAEVTVSLCTEQRLKHMHVIGASGTGKSTLLLQLIAQDMEQGNGLAILDPHGDLIEEVLGRVPEERLDKVILFDPSDGAYPIGFNILSAHSELEKTLLSSDLVSLFRRFATSWGDQMTSILSNAILAILENPDGSTLQDLRRFLVDADFRRSFLTLIPDPEIRFFWEKEYPLLQNRSLGSILTRLDTFLRPRLIRNIIAQKDNALDLAAIMNGRKILLLKLSQGAIGEENAYLLGTLFLAKLHQMALSRQQLAAKERVPFFVYIDEFHQFVTPSLASILSGARKYGLGLILAHQDLQQLEGRDRDVTSAVLSNPYTRVCFRLGDSDARKLAEGFSTFTHDDLTNLGTGEAIVRIDRSSYDFNLTVPLPSPVNPDLAERKRDYIVELSRSRYGRRKEEIELKLLTGRTSISIEPEIPQPKPEPMLETVSETKELPARSNGKVKTPAPSKVPKDRKEPVAPPLPGRGGAEHKYLQQFIKRWAEGMGYKAIIEKSILDGKGSVDLSLEKSNTLIACEITVTTSDLHELHNAKKCLEAGYPHVVLVTPDAKRIRKIEELLKQHLSAEEQSQVRCLTVDDLFLFVETLEAQEAVQENTVCGYKVKVNYHPVDGTEQKTKKEAISKVILQSMKRMKGGK